VDLLPLLFIGQTASKLDWVERVELVWAIVRWNSFTCSGHGGMMVMWCVDQVVVVAAATTIIIRAECCLDYHHNNPSRVGGSKRQERRDPSFSEQFFNLRRVCCQSDKGNAAGKYIGNKIGLEITYWAVPSVNCQTLQLETAAASRCISPHAFL
jgi:hypothetical protein